MARRILALAGTLALFTPAALVAQSAQDFLAAARADYDDRMSGIQNYTVSQNFMGIVTIMYFERHDVEGRIVFLPDPSRTTVNGEPLEQMEGQAAGAQMDGNYFLRPEVVDRARIDGSLNVDGNDCWIIVIDDFEGLDLDIGSQMGAGDFEPRVLHLYMDKDEYVARRMDFDGTMTAGTETQDMSASTLMTDYREIDGMWYPFRVEIKTDSGGTPDASGAAAPSTQEQAAMQAMIDQMGEDLSDAERAMIEGLLQSDEGAALMGQAMSSIVVETTAVTVNSGPPAGDH